MTAAVKKAGIKDIEILNTISLESKKHWGYPNEWIEKWTDDLTLKENDFVNQHIFKLETQSSIIGWCSIQENNSNYEINHLWLRPEYIGSGLGKQLLNETIQKIVVKKKPLIVEADPHAEAFYARQGFVTFGKVESSPKGRYLPLMRKEL